MRETVCYRVHGSGSDSPISRVRSGAVDCLEQCEELGRLPFAASRQSASRNCFGATPLSENHAARERVLEHGQRPEGHLAYLVRML